MQPRERSRLAHRAVAIQRKLDWLSQNYIRLGDTEAVHSALYEELHEIKCRLAAEFGLPPPLVPPFRRST